MKAPVKKLPSQDEIKRLLDYNPVTGIFTWRPRDKVAPGWNTKWAGKVAGAHSVNGWQIQFNWKLFYAHRLAWIYVHGDVLNEKTQIDHKNCDHFDNRLENLRVASHGQNAANSRLRQGRNLPKGVTQDTRWKDRYFARITIDRTSYYLGSFKNPHDAHRAYWAATQAAKGEFARKE
jgi:hypothetical protein